MKPRYESSPQQKAQLPPFPLIPTTQHLQLLLCGPHWEWYGQLKSNIVTLALNEIQYPANNTRTNVEHGRCGCAGYLYHSTGRPPLSCPRQHNIQHGQPPLSSAHRIYNGHVPKPILKFHFSPHFACTLEWHLFDFRH